MKLSALARTAALAARSPRAGTEAARTATHHLLDRRFEERSPLPVLDDAMQRRIGREAVALPGMSLFDPGNQDIFGLMHLVSIARFVSARTIFEIGTYNGLTAFTLALNLPEAIVHTLDLEPGQGPTLRVLDDDAAHIGRGDAGRVYEGTPQAQRIVQHLGDSAGFDFAPFADDVDLVYVDGAHSYEYVSRDTSSAFAIVHDAGAVVWDDYWRGVPDVPRYLDGLTDRQLFRLPRSRLVVWFGPGSAV